MRLNHKVGAERLHAKCSKGNELVIRFVVAAVSEATTYKLSVEHRELFDRLVDALIDRGEHQRQSSKHPRVKAVLPITAFAIESPDLDEVVLLNAGIEHANQTSFSNFSR